MIRPFPRRLLTLRQTPARPGAAALELAFALPILTALLTIIFGICSITETRMSVTLSARNNTFEKRHTPWSHDARPLELPHVQTVAKILGTPIKMPANSGMVSDSATAEPTGLFGPLSRLTLRTDSERFVLGGGWDYQEIEFKKHEALTMTDKAKVFAVNQEDLEAFKKTGSFGVGGNSSSGRSFGQIQGQVQQSLQNAQQQITSRLAEIQQQLRQLGNQLNQQKQQLANLRKNPNADPNAVRQAEQQVKKTQAKIDKLKSEQTQQSRAKSSLGFRPNLPASSDVSATEESAAY